MRSKFRAAALCVASLALPFALPGAVASPQEPAQPAGPDPTADLEALKKALDERKAGKEEVRAAADDAAVGAIDRLTAAFATFDEKGQKKVVADLGQVFRVRTDPEENRIHLAAAAALSEMGKDAEAALVAAFKVKALEERTDVQEALLESLAKHKNPKHVEMFLEVFRGDQNQIMAAATRALAEYRDADAKVRKQIVEGLVKEYANVNALDAKERGTHPVWHERKLALEVPMNETLAALTLQNFQTAPEWEAWYNDNRNKKW
jgi:hypothetical protein